MATAISPNAARYTRWVAVALVVIALNALIFLEITGGLA